MDKNIFHLVENSTSGIDLLGIFYTEFVKYSNTDGNELGIVLTPHHIVDFMCKLVNVNKNSRVLDPTCGTGAFLVTAMSYMLKDAKNDKEIEKHIKQEQLYGIEKDEDVYDLAIINMIIRKDGKSNIKHANCFSEQEWIKNCRINTLLMNPPYSLSKKKKNGNETDESLCELNFLKNAMDYIEVNGFACIILPTSSAIGNKFPNTRELLFSKHTLLGVFSMPNDVFYPTAVNTCVMLWKAHTPHDSNKETFFGYYKDDGFKKKKSLGRVDQGEWKNIEKEWIKLFDNKEVVAGKSVLAKVRHSNEWLAEAYMETDYSTLKQEDFEETINEYLSYLVRNGGK